MHSTFPGVTCVFVYRDIYLVLLYRYGQLNVTTRDGSVGIQKK